VEPVKLPTRKAEALLAYLVASSGIEQRREKLVSLLWGERRDAQARHSLAQTILVIRKALGDGARGALVSSGQSVFLEPSCVDVDVWQFERLAAKQMPDADIAAMELYRGIFLDGICVREQAFDDWLRDERDRLKSMACETLGRIIDRRIAAGDDGHAIEAARRLLELDPYRERAHRSLMRLHHRAGHDAAALRQYQICAEILREELGIEPDAETRALRDKILGSRSPPGDRSHRAFRSIASPLRGSVSGGPVIAVLPFSGFGDDLAHDAFCGGIAEDIIAGLSRVSGCSVIALDLVSTDERDARGVKRMADELGVRYVLAGALRRTDDVLRVNVKLIDAGSGSYLWAERYDGNLVDVFALDEIAETIVGSVETILIRTEQDRAIRSAARNLQAYDYAMRGAAYDRRMTSEDNIKAQDMFERAIGLDPDNAQALAGLAGTLLHANLMGRSPDPRKVLGAASEYAKQALALDDSLAKAHVVLGAVHLFSGRNELAVAEGKRAIALDPGNADAHESLAFFLIADGLAPEALCVAEKALRFNPLHPTRLYYTTLSSALYLTEQYEAAAKAGEQALPYDSDSRASWLRTTAAYAQLGDMDRAQRHAHELIKVDPEFSLNGFSKFLPYKRTPDINHYVEGLRMAGLPELR
jgi:DNA-binding SARP family transcriptional activator